MIQMTLISMSLMAIGMAIIIMGFISVFECPGGDFTSLEKCKILTDNQHRLRGDYQTVFNNIHNEAYVAPSYAKYHQSIDDDIPF